LQPGALFRNPLAANGRIPVGELCEFWQAPRARRIIESRSHHTRIDFATATTWEFHRVGRGIGAGEDTAVLRPSAWAVEMKTQLGSTTSAHTTRLLLIVLLAFCLTATADRVASMVTGASEPNGERRGKPTANACYFSAIAALIQVTAWHRAPTADSTKSVSIRRLR
jgi:hypothetical protein